MLFHWRMTGLEDPILCITDLFQFYARTIFLVIKLICAFFSAIHVLYLGNMQALLWFHFRSVYQNSKVVCLFHIFNSYRYNRGPMILTAICIVYIVVCSLLQILKSGSLIEVNQEQTYGDIIVSATPRLEAALRSSEKQ